jgi:hypothetical protein
MRVTFGLGADPRSFSTSSFAATIERVNVHLAAVVWQRDRAGDLRNLTTGFVATAGSLSQFLSTNMRARGKKRHPEDKVRGNWDMVYQFASRKLDTADASESRGHAVQESRRVHLSGGQNTCSES